MTESNVRRRRSRRRRGSDCAQGVAFITATAALGAANATQASVGTPYETMHCTDCGNWHIRARAEELPVVGVDPAQEGSDASAVVLWERGGRRAVRRLADEWQAAPRLEPRLCRRGHPMQPGRTRCLICHPETEPGDSGVCRICGRHEDTRSGVCFSCADNAGPVGPERISSTSDPPANPNVGDVWFDPATNITSIWDGRDWRDARAPSYVPIPERSAEDTPDPPAGSGWVRRGNQWVNEYAINVGRPLPFLWGEEALRYGQNPLDQLARCRQCGNEIDARTTRPRDLRNGYCSAGCAQIMLERQARQRQARERARERIEEPDTRMERREDAVFQEVEAWWDPEARRMARRVAFPAQAGIGLGPQLWIGGPRRRAPSQETFNKIENDGGFAVKPKGGLWTSSFIPDKGSGWTDWCLSEDFNVPENGWTSWLLFPTSDAQILRIHTYEDLKTILESEYGADMEWRAGIAGDRCLNFEKLAGRFDAIWLTEEGQWATRLTHPYSLYGWDCESVLWLNWGGIDWSHTQSLGTVRWGQSPEPPMKPRRLRGPRRRF